MRLFKRILFFLQSFAFYSIYSNKKSITLGRNIRIKGFPIVFIKNGGKVHIGDNVTINSSNYGYHINMHSPVKIMVDRPNAEIFIGTNSRIHGTCMHAYNKIKIGENCLIAANTQIIDGNGHDLCLDNPSERINTVGNASEINISDNVWIGANCIILPGVTIGKGSVIAAGSIVTKEVPEKCVVAGNPASIIKSIS